MRLVCDRCGSRFRIADDLVRGRAVKVRCRGCGAAVDVPPLPAGQRPRRMSRQPPPPPTGAREWYLAVGQAEVGPLGLDELHLRVQRGEVGADDLVWCEGLSGWEPISGVPEVRAALGLPRPRPRSMPPALPSGPGPAPAEGPRLAGHPGAQQATQPRPRYYTAEQEPAPRRPAPRRVARWPLVLLVVGGLLLVAGGLVLLLCRDDPAPARRRSGLRTVRVHFPPPEQTPPERPEVLTDPLLLDEPLPIEVRIPRRPAVVPASRPGRADAGRPDAGRHFEVELVTRILRRNRSTLMACDRLAERRGESLEGTRARFAVRVDATGEATVTVSGEELSDDLIGCYRSMVRRWEIPRIGRPYTARFFHVHRSH